MIDDATDSIEELRKELKKDLERYNNNIRSKIDSLDKRNNYFTSQLESILVERREYIYLNQNVRELKRHVKWLHFSAAILPPICFIALIVAAILHNYI